MIDKIRAAQNAYPRQFWTIFWGTLINSAGSSLIFPFLSLYLTRQLSFSMTEVGTLFAFYAIASILFQVIGSGLVDRIGRKPIMLFSLFGSVIATFVFGWLSPAVAQLGQLRLIGMAGLLLLFAIAGPIFGPAVNAMVADLVQGPKRTEAYGLIRVVSNLGVAIGPAVGGFIATKSYFVLFMGAAAASATYGVIALTMIRETRPQLDDIPKSDRKPNQGRFIDVLKDSVFVQFCILTTFSVIVYSQMNTTLPVFLKVSHGVSEGWYGLLMSLNAMMVVLFQFPVTRVVTRYPSGWMMAAGMVLYAVGFGMFGFVTGLPLFFLAQATWTMGELVTSPVGQAFVANAAPVTMRGRYMGVYGLTWGAGYGIGPLFGGLLMDRMYSNAIWYLSFGLCSLLGIGFLSINKGMQTITDREKKQGSV